MKKIKIKDGKKNDCVQEMKDFTYEDVNKSETGVRKGINIGN